MWSNDLELNFLEAYQQEPIIWEPNNAHHKDRNKVLEAWKRISTTLDIPIIELKKKKDSLMATYRMHLRRMKASLQLGASADEVYKPIWFAFDLMHSFLRETVNNQSKRRNTIDQGIDKENETVDEAQRQNDGEEGGESQEMEQEDSFSPKPTIRRNEKSSEVKTAERMMHDTVGILKDYWYNRHEEDECDLYGKILAKKLRKLPEEEKLNFMYEIDGIYIRRIQSLKRTKAASILITPHSDPSYLLEQQHLNHSFPGFPTVSSPSASLVESLSRPPSSGSYHSDSLTTPVPYQQSLKQIPSNKTPFSSPPSTHSTNPTPKQSPSSNTNTADQIISSPSQPDNITTCAYDKA